MILQKLKGTFLYSNAGQCPGLLLKRSEGDTIWLTINGMPLGILEENRWEQREVSFSPGDVLLLYTDGVIEADNEMVRPYG